MKNSNQLVSHLRSQSAFAPLSNIPCINAVKDLLPPRLHRFILFGYIRHNIVFFALNHPGAKQEFDNIINSIKLPLKQIPPMACSKFKIYDIKAFVSYKTSLRPSTDTLKEVQFEERSVAQFDNNLEDKKLHQLAEEIRDIIKSKS